jgi:hypothetical protein
MRTCLSLYEIFICHWQLAALLNVRARRRFEFGQEQDCSTLLDSLRKQLTSNAVKDMDLRADNLRVYAANTHVCERGKRKLSA